MRETNTLAADEIDLLPYARALMRGVLMVLAAAVVGGLAGYVVSLRHTPEYESAATLVVTVPKVGEPERTVIVVPASAFRPYFENQSVARQIIESHRLGRFHITTNTFFSGIARVEEMRGGSALRISVRFHDPSEAAAIANELAQRGMAQARAAAAQEASTIREELRPQLDGARDRMLDAERRLAEYEVSGRPKPDERGATLRRLQRELGLAERLYSDVSLRYEEAPVQVIENRARLQMADPAGAPTEPLPSGRARRLVFGAFVGSAIAAALIVLRERARMRR